MYNSIDNGHPYQTPCIRVKGSDRRSFVLILDWMLVNATLIIRMNLSRHLSQTFAKQKRKNLKQLYQRFLFSLFDTSIMSQIVARVQYVKLFYLLIVVDWFSHAIVSNISLVDS